MTMADKSRFSPRKVAGKAKSKRQRKTTKAENPTHFEILKAFIGTVKGPRDLARNHTFYAHGGPRR